MPPLDPYGAFVSTNPSATGRTIAVKDMIGVAGHPHEAGLAVRAGRTAHTDAAIVATLKAAGYTVAGVTVTDAAGFGTMTYAVTNPNHPAQAVGGSSGGSGAAVAARLATIGLGTDTGGSVRIPAAYCGLYAFMPSQTAVSVQGVLPMSPTFDRLGIMARGLEDLLDAAKALLGPVPEPKAPARLVHWHDGLALSTEAIVDDMLSATGPLPVWTPPVSHDQYAMLHSVIVCAEAWAVHRADFEARPDCFPDAARQGLQRGATVGARFLAHCRQAMAERAGEIAGSLPCGTIAIAPTLAIPPQPRFTESAVLDGSVEPIVNANIRLTTLANVAGFPVFVVPVGNASLQLMARPGDDLALLAFARTFADRLNEASVTSNPVGIS